MYGGASGRGDDRNYSQNERISTRDRGVLILV